LGSVQPWGESPCQSTKNNYVQTLLTKINRQPRESQETALCPSRGTARLFPVPLPPPEAHRQRLPETHAMLARPGTVIDRQPLPASGSLMMSAPFSASHASPEMNNDGKAIMGVLEQLAQRVLWETAQILLEEVLSTDYQKSYRALREL